MGKCAIFLVGRGTKLYRKCTDFVCS